MSRSTTGDGNDLSKFVINDWPENQESASELKDPSFWIKVQPEQQQQNMTPDEPTLVQKDIVMLLDYL